MRAIILLCLLTFSLPSLAEKDFSSWRKFSQGQLISESTAVTPGSMATLALRVRLAKGWHTYWVNPGDSGTAVRLKFNLSKDVVVSQVLLPYPQRTEVGPLISFDYADEVIFPIKLDVGANVKRKIAVKVDAEWLICESVCIPAIDSFELELPVAAASEVKPTADFEAIQNALAHVPTLTKQEVAFSNNTLQFPNWTAEREFIDFFPFKGSGVSNDKPQAKVTNGSLTLVFEGSAVQSVAKDRIGVLLTKRDGQIEATQFGRSGFAWEQSSDGAIAAGGLLWMLLSAFLGGLILNLMPCVFPILSIKLLSLLKLGKSHRHEIQQQNWAYVVGVMVSFLAIALLLAGLRSAGQFVGWGFQLQSPVFLSLLIWIFFALTLNLLGLFDLDFINAGWGHKLTRSGGLAGSFFTGVLAVVVASPCTAPFMGVALGFGLSQPTAVLVAVFLALGLGLAFPYVVFAIFPQVIGLLPKPGAWMNHVKRVMALPLLATVIWLAWILSTVRGTNAVAVVIAGCVLIGAALGLKSRRRWLEALTLVALLAGAAFIYAGSSDSASDPAAVATKEDDDWQPFSVKRLQALRGSKVFVNMTADWCLTCKVNERIIFSDPEVLSLLKNLGVVMLKGDWTKRNEEITRFLNDFDRVGVPFYVLYSQRHPEGLALPEVLTKSSFIQIVNQEFSN